MTDSTATRIAVLAIALGVAACNQTQPLGTGLPAEVTCHSCHGSTENNAPPHSVDGATATTDPAVGAHQSHVRDSSLRQAIACSECHPVPREVTDPGHNNGVINVIFGSLASAGGTTPVWSGQSLSCSASYCHGATLSGGTNKNPVWTKVDGTQAACGTCHGNPPPIPHPPRTDCNTCHPLTVKPDGTIDVAGGHHINGQLEVVTLSCSTCHGSTTNNAPPVSAHGATATTDITVGAHQSHMQDSALRKALACTDCHLLPASVDSPGHIIDGPAPVIFGALAATSGLTPVWDRTSATCSNVYCHGAQAPGGSLKTPQWTKVDNTQAACGTCHGNPPPFPHPQRTDCTACHPQTVRADGTIDVAGGHHINGIQEVSITCSSCHGSGANNAPPQATTGATATSDVRVGAHQTHVTAGPLHSALACTECHVLPTSITDPGHIVSGPAPVVFGSLAATGGLAPTWDHDSATCSNVYCHGTQAPGGTLKTPQWTKVDHTQAACGTCHGDPPPFPHPQRADCNACHPMTVLPNGDIDIAGGHHINGIAEVSVNCSSCHGSAANNAPPKATTGATATTDVRVGAHQTHVTDGKVRAAIACNECHIVPSSITDPGHIVVGPAPLNFGTLATTSGLAPAFNSDSATCSNVYCHGATIAGGTNKTPIWTQVDGTQDACGTCHGAPPPAPHLQLTACDGCHPGTVNHDGTINITGGLHINGSIEVQDVHPAADIWTTPGSGNFHGDSVSAKGIAWCQRCHGADLSGGGTGISCDSCHKGGTAWRTNCTFCHGGSDNLTGAPPTSLSHGFSTQTVGVGAHTSHVEGSANISSPVACSECHVVPTDIFSAGHVVPPPATLTWGPLAQTGGAAPAWNANGASCSTSYCHGDFPGGNAGNTPKWTRVDGTQAACGTCHATAPTTGQHPAAQPGHAFMGSDCTYCHNGETNSTGTAIIAANKALHANGVKDVNFRTGGTWTVNPTKNCTTACHTSQKEW